MIDKTTLWTVIIGLGIGSYALRFAFIGIVGNRPMPAWLTRHLRYTAVAILPALVAPAKRSNIPVKSRWRMRAVFVSARLIVALSYPASAAH